MERVSASVIAQLDWNIHGQGYCMCHTTTGLEQLWIGLVQVQ